ncbi:DEAD/DEAH box helicase family protein [Wolbachia endosymbiont (group A) of Cheilosia soror]|uniref:DEAD/DEAH box helicase family protein n=1 Tax=Wolbachia endosymbiont (group A) of Cheilosia soror TaxID=2953995 RepID=UPI0021F880B1|nr:DEAD/DEAH box helicase family protein [Wolbachia endosymbiont (group A) of Cheilosia soror]
MSSVSNQGKQSIIKSLKKINLDLQGESMKLFDGKESIIVKRRKPVVKGILEHLKSPSITNCNTMIDAETGFGKTYDIGLWSHVLAKTGYHHLVAVPNGNLVEQAKKMIDGAFIVDVKTPKTVQEIKDALKVTKPTTIIVTHDLLLQQENDRKFEEQNGEKPKLWVSVDEADSINKQQAFENMCKLDEEYPTTYLTATPKRRILKRCGKIVSPIRSSRHCIANTIRTMSVIAKTNRREKFILALAVNTVLYLITINVLFTIVNNFIVVEAVKIGFTNPLLFVFLIPIVSNVITYVIMALIAWVIGKIIGVELRAFFSRVIANLSSLVNKEKSSPAHEYVEECEEIFGYNKLVDTDDLLTSVRWNVQSPIGENALILVDDIDSIINLNFALQGHDNQVLEDGKTYNRHEIYNKYKPEGMLYRDYRLKLRQSNFVNCVKKKHPSLTKEQVSELKEKVDFSDTAKYLKYRVMHSMIDLTLSCLMKCDNIALDEQRRKDLDKLIGDIKNKVGTANDDSIIDFLKEKGFSEQFARNELLLQIKAVIEALSKSNDKQRSLIVDNWHLSKELHSFIEQQRGVLRDLNNFCEKNKCIFAGMKKNDLGVEKGKSFFGLHNYKVTPSGRGKCEADYCNYRQDDLSTLAKYALTTIVDESKGRGFDSEYNHVASIFNNSTSQFNNPAEALQNLGRNRERNISRQPWFFAATGEKVELFVDKVLAKLKSAPQNFCQKVLFPATDRYNKLIKNRMGVELGKKIEIYISENVDILGNIDEQKLKDFCKNEVSQVYDKVHNINDFNVKKTEKDLHRILKGTEKYLHSYRDRIKNNKKLSLTNRAIFFIISAVFKAVYYIWFAFDYVIFVAKSCTLNERTDERNVITYAYVVRNCSLESVLKSEKILYKAFEAAEDVHQNCKEKSYYTSNLSECMEKIVGLFQNKVYINALDKLFSSFLLKKEGERHLLTILNAIYPDEKDNEDKREKIINFKKDLERLECKELVNKYCQGSTYQDTDLCMVVKWINGINKEVAACQAYYHSVNKLINVDEPRLKTDHHLFNIRVIYSWAAFKNSDLSPTHSKLLFFIRLNSVARCVIVVFLFPRLLGLITQIGSFVVSMVLSHLVLYFPEKFREFLFNDNIQNDSCSAVNELDLLSKQSEVKYMKEAAEMIIATDLSSILVQSVDDKKLQV